MTLVALSQVERTFGEHVVFSGVSLRIGDRDHLGIVGDNGSGKTTLLRVLCGEDPPDHGARTARKDLRIAWTAQVPALPSGQTVLGAALEALSELEKMEEELRTLEDAMTRSPADARLATRHERVHVEFERSGGYLRERLAEKTLYGLGFAKEDLGKPAAVLSGGEKARVALARAMLVPANLLVLDEPTNHLDLEGITFLEEWLSKRTGAFVVVSHDRRFLDRVCTSIAEVEGTSVRRYRGNFSAFKEQKDRELETAAREHKKQQDFVEKELAYIRKHMAGRWSAQAKGRLKRLMRLERIAKPRAAGRNLKLRLGNAKGLSGQTILEAHDLAASFPGNPLFENVELRVFHGDRAGLLGRNGVGKSTLLEILAGQRRPAAGHVERAKTLRLAYFSQEMEDLPQTGTVLGTMQSLVPQWNEGECRDWLARFLFQGDEVDKDLQTLSGGEKRRLCLARLLVAPADVYLLDEPTNHLDISTREALEEALGEFEGTVLAVSHDRYFLEKAVRRIFELTPRGISVYEGGITQYEERLAERRRAGTSDDDERPAKTPPPSRPAATTKSEDTQKIRNPWAFDKLEKRIFALEEELETVRGALTGADVWRDADKMKDTQRRQHEIQEELEELYEQWENWQ